MPSKIQLDENLWFLFVCLQKSDYKVIDFNAVGDATNLKPPAARMRYTRLKRQIEGGTLIGTHGTPFAGGAEKIAEAMKKRKKGGQDAVKSDENRKSSSVESEREDSDSGEVREKEARGKRGKRAEIEDEESYESEGGDGSESEEDSDDDKPIIKRRGRCKMVVRKETVAMENRGVRSTADNGYESQVLELSDQEYSFRQPEQTQGTSGEPEMVDPRYQNFETSLRASGESNAYNTIRAGSMAEDIASAPRLAIPLSPGTHYARLMHHFQGHNHSNSYLQHQSPLYKISPKFSYRTTHRPAGAQGVVKYDFVPLPSLPSKGL